jgi:hypothetical protein
MRTYNELTPQEKDDITDLVSGFMADMSKHMPSTPPSLELWDSMLRYACHYADMRETLRDLARAGHKASKHKLLLQLDTMYQTYMQWDDMCMESDWLLIEYGEIG